MRQFRYNVFTLDHCANDYKNVVQSNYYTQFFLAAGGRVYVLYSDGTVYASAIPIQCIDPVCECHQTLNDTTREQMHNIEQARIIEGMPIQCHCFRIFALAQ